uniref:Uncharacterized protein n=1 Tax=Romanomermis culicivorax TaxID=13658 RepID=A0A915IU79_ROMCU
MLFMLNMGINMGLIVQLYQKNQKHWERPTEIANDEFEDKAVNSQSEQQKRKSLFKKVAASSVEESIAESIPTQKTKSPCPYTRSLKKNSNRPHPPSWIAEALESHEGSKLEVLILSESHPVAVQIDQKHEK